MLFLPDIKIGWPVCSEQMLDKIQTVLGEIYPVPEVTERGSILATGALLPSLRPDDISTEQRRLSVDFPFFGLANASEDKLLVILSPDCDPRNMQRHDRCVPLFTSAKHAESFQLAFGSDWTEPHQIHEFNANNVVDLVHRLDDLIPHTDRIVFDIFSEQPKIVDLEKFVSGLRTIVERFVHAGRTGIMGTIVREHELPEAKVLSILLSTGR